MILLSLILLLGIGTMPDLHSSSELALKTKAEIALAKLNAALPAEAEKLRLSDFNATGERDLALNIRCPANELAKVILNHHQSGYFGGDGYYTALTGNNHSSAGKGERGAYLNVVAQLKKIRDTGAHSTTGDGGSGYAEGHAAPISTPMRKLMDTTTPLATLHPTALPQPAPSHPAAGATSTTTGHTPPLDATPAVPVTTLTPPAGPQEDPQPTGNLADTHTDQASAPIPAPVPNPDSGHSDVPRAVPVTDNTPPPAADRPTNTNPETPGTVIEPHVPVVTPVTHLIKTRIPYTKPQKGAVAAGSLATAAGLAWLFTLLAQKESREDIKLFWGKLFSKKTRAAVATRAARIRSEIKRHGNESIGALTTTLAGLGLLLYGGLPRYKKPTHTQAHGAEGTN